MTENETQQSNPSPVSTSDAPATEVVEVNKKSSLKFYLVAVLAVLVVLSGVLYMMEKEGKSPTNVFGSLLESQVAGTIVATVNGTDIVNKDLNTSVEQFNQMALSQGVDITNQDISGEIREQALEVLINTELLKQAASDRGITVSQEEIDDRLVSIELELGGEEVLLERMESLGITESRLQSDIQEELVIQKLLEQIFAGSEIEVTEEEISAVYNNAGGTEAGLPSLEEVSAQVRQQILASKEQEIIDGYINELKVDANIYIVEG